MMGSRRPRLRGFSTRRPTAGPHDRLVATATAMTRSVTPKCHQKSVALLSGWPSRDGRPLSRVGARGYERSTPTSPSRMRPARAGWHAASQRLRSRRLAVDHVAAPAGQPVVPFVSGLRKREWGRVRDVFRVTALSRRTDTASVSRAER